MLGSACRPHRGRFRYDLAIGLPQEFTPRQHTLSNCIQGDFRVARGCVLRIRG
jgi:hypothetical protein